MSASITTFDLGWSTPEGHPVFSNINLSFNDERVGIVGRNGVGKTSLLKLLAGEREPTAGKIVVRGKVCMLRQIVQVEPDDSIASLFGLDGPLDLLRKAEEGRATMEELAEADWTLEARIVQAFARVRLDATPYSLLTSLSGGQRTRAAMAGVLLEDPDFLLLDEPSNNLDREGKRALIELLASWRGGAIIVSHDRDLLETMDAIVEMTTLGATRYGGNWSRYRERKVIELAAARHDLDTAERQMAEIERKSQVAIERKQRRDATGRRRGARGDLPRILAGARKERAENSGGENARLAERLWQDATAAMIAAKQQIERTETLLLTFPTTGLPAGKTVLDMHRVSAGYDKRSPVLRDFSLTVTGPERIAIIGPNGSGKTTLLGIIAHRISPMSGTLTRTASFAMLDQAAGILDPAKSIAENYRTLNPSVDELGCRSALAKFQFKADAALQLVGSLSGGQVLRAGLACILGSPTPPQLLVLDEPTNHLDLESIEAVEAGLAAFDGALIVVSHDDAFLDAISISRRIRLATNSA